MLCEGYHNGPGQLHAERSAIMMAIEQGLDLNSSVLYVNLEPCCHFGRTPPCTDIIIASGVSTVVVAMQDPDPRMRGRGIAILRDAGIDVIVGVGDAVVVAAVVDVAVVLVAIAVVVVKTCQRCCRA